LTRTDRGVPDRRIAPDTSAHGPAAPPGVGRCAALALRAPRWIRIAPSGRIVPARMHGGAEDYTMPDKGPGSKGGAKKPKGGKAAGKKATVPAKSEAAAKR
jgi:hypothetical protein